jgi:hypothetical protein
VAVCRTAQLSSLPWCLCVKRVCCHSGCSHRCKEARNPAASTGYCNSRTGRRASGDRRFIQEDARIVTYFLSYRLVPVLTVQAECTAISISWPIIVLHERFLFSSCLI